MAEPIKIVVSGAAGRMGETACGAVEGADDMELVGRADPALDTAVADVLEGADVLVDFTTPDAAPANVIEAINSDVHAVVGSTGFDLDELKATVLGADGKANCFVAPNFAIGAVLMMEAAKLIAPHMSEAEIIELHHDQKKDAPSGTLWKLVEEMKKAGYGAKIDVSSNRAGAHPGTHEIGFDSAADTITLRHVARSREGFAQGALRAAKWLVGKKGFYEFGDIVFSGQRSAVSKPAGQELKAES